MPFYKKLTIIIILLAALTTTSCWNRREVIDLAIVSAVGIDVGPEPGTITVTSQIIKPGQIQTGAEGITEKAPYFNVTSTGATVFDAIRKSARFVDRRLYFPHAHVLIISEAVAKEGVTKHIDFMVRDPEFRRDTFVLIFKGNTARLLEAKTEINEIPSRSLYQLIKRRTGASLASAVSLLEFMQRLMSKTTAPIASLVEISADGRTLKLTGTSVFKKDKLVGYLDEIETRGLLWVLDEVVFGMINVKCPSNDGNVSLEIISSSGKINPQIKEDKIQIEIKVAVQVHIGEQECPGDLTKTEKSALLKKEAEDVVTKEINAALSKAQELGSDIFGFGDAIHKKYPQRWREMEPDWDKIFSQTEVVLKVESKLTRTGMTSKTARPKQ